ncbi:hypothetical protein [Emticicia fontis]
MDKILSWLENNQITCYQIFDVSREKRSERQCTSVSDAQTEFAKDYDILPNGKYSIKGMVNAKADRSAVKYDFTIGQLNTNTTGGMDLDKLKAEIYAQARKDFEFELLDKRIKEQERKLNIVIQVLAGLTDDDESNDEKSKGMLDILANAKENFDSAKDMLKDLKF